MRNARTHRNSTDRKLVFKKKQLQNRFNHWPPRICVCLWECVDGNQIRRLKKKQILTFFRDIGAKEARTKKNLWKKFSPTVFCCCCGCVVVTDHHHLPLLTTVSPSLSLFLAFSSVFWSGRPKTGLRVSPMNVFFFSFLSLHYVYVYDSIVVLYFFAFFTLSFVCMCLRVFSVLFLHFSFPGAVCVFVCMCVCVLMLHKSKRCFCVCLCFRIILLTCCYFSINPIN